MDAGFSCRQLKQRLLAAGKDPSRVNGILISHSHSDHIKGVARFCKEYKVPVYCNSLTQKEISITLLNESKTLPPPDFKIFNSGDSFELGDIGVCSFQIQHDTSDPVGFVFQTGGLRLGVVTDLGKVTSLVQERVRGTYALLFESNHDKELLRQANRPWSIKQRIMGNFGHLSNEQAVEGLKEIAEEGLHELVLGHLSQECNRSELALSVAKGALGGGEIKIRVSSQEEPTWILPKGFSI